MAKAVGIDLGTTNAVIAVVEGDQPIVITDSEGARTVPSVVAFADSGERLVGQIARRQAILNPKDTAHSAKRFIGRRHEESTEEAEAVTFDVVEGTNGAARFEINGQQYAPEEVSALILRKLAGDATKYLGEKVTQAVITVPAYFNDAQRQATRDAGKIAGLEVLRIINEPTAAALAYGLDKQRHETVLVVDLGGGTLDVSILEVGDGIVEVRATAGDGHLGGDDFNRRLVDCLADEFERDQKIDLRGDPQALQRLFGAAEKAKVELSSVTRTQVNLPFITAGTAGPKHLTTTVTRSTFEQFVADLVERCRHPVEQQLVRRLTGGKDPDMGVSPDEVVALGAAVQAAALTGEGPDVLLLDVIPLSLSLATTGGVITKIIERNTMIPVRRTEVFSTAQDNQPAVDIVVLQGEREPAEDNRVIGRLRLENLRPAPRGVPQIEVTTGVDADGIFTVSARDRDTGAEQTVTITETGNLDRSEVERMAQDAGQHHDEVESPAYRIERPEQSRGPLPEGADVIDAVLEAS